MIPETCNGCKYKSYCNGKIARGSPHCKRLVSSQPVKKHFGWFLRLFNGDKRKALIKYAGERQDD